MNPIITMTAHVRRREACHPVPVVTRGIVLPEPLVLLWDELLIRDLRETVAHAEELANG